MWSEKESTCSFRKTADYRNYDYKPDNVTSEDIRSDIAEAALIKHHHLPGA